MARILIAGAILFLSALALASNVYVSKVTGFDAAGYGSEALPYRTIQYAITQSPAGSVIFLSGTFTENFTVSKSVTIRSKSGSSATKSTIIGEITLGSGVTFKDAALYNLLLQVDATFAFKSIAMAGAILDNLTISSCDFVVSGSVSGPIVGGAPVLLAGGLTFANCLFENDATVTSAFVDVSVPAAGASAAGAVTLSGCSAAGNKPLATSANKATVVSIATTKGAALGIEVTKCDTATGGVFSLSGYNLSVHDNTFSGLGVVIKSADRASIYNNQFSDFGTYHYGLLSNPSAPASLTFQLASAGTFSNVKVYGNTFSNVLNTATKKYGAISVPLTITEDTWDVEISENDFSGVAHSEYAFRMPSEDRHNESVRADLGSNFWGDKLGPFSAVCNAGGRGATISDTADATDVCVDALCEEHERYDTRCAGSGIEWLKDGTAVASVIVSVGGTAILAAGFWIASFALGQRLPKDSDDTDSGEEPANSIQGVYAIPAELSCHNVNFGGASVAKPSAPVVAAAPAPKPQPQQTYQPQPQPQQPKPQPVAQPAPKPVVQAAPAPAPAQPAHAQAASQSKRALVVKPPPEPQAAAASTRPVEPLEPQALPASAPVAAAVVAPVAVATAAAPARPIETLEPQALPTAAPAQQPQQSGSRSVSGSGSSYTGSASKSGSGSGSGSASGSGSSSGSGSGSASQSGSGKKEAPAAAAPAGEASKRPIETLEEPKALANVSASVSQSGSRSRSGSGSGSGSGSASKSGSRSRSGSGSASKSGSGSVSKSGSGSASKSGSGSASGSGSRSGSGSGSGSASGSGSKSGSGSSSGSGSASGSGAKK